MEGVYLAGEPDTNSDASLMIGFEPLDEIFNLDSPDYDEDLLGYWELNYGDDGNLVDHL